MHFLLALSLLLNGIFTQDLNSLPVSDRSSIPSKSTDIYIQAYLAAKNFAPAARAAFLTRLCLAAAESEPALVRLWAEELYQLSFQLPEGHDRTAHQKNALVALSASDPVRAMELFATLNLPVPVAGDLILEDVRADAARFIFARYWGKVGFEGIEVLREQAQRLGVTGEYPFLAMAPIIVEVASSDAVLAQNLFEEGTLHFLRDPRIYGQEDRFLRSLQLLKGVLPDPAIRSALHLMVQRLEDFSANTEVQVFVAEVQTQKGRIVVRDPADLILLEALPLIQAIDSEWAADLVQNRQILKQISEQGGPVRIDQAVMRGDMSKAKTPLEQRLALEGSRLFEILSQVEKDPETALRLSAELTDPRFRAKALGAIAFALAQSAPIRSRAIANQLKAMAGQLDSGISKLEVLTRLAHIEFALGDRTSAEKYLHGAFEVGVEMFDRQTMLYPDRSIANIWGFDELSELVRLGTKIAPANMLEVVKQLPNDLLRAHLLVVTARVFAEAQKQQPKSGK